MHDEALFIVSILLQEQVIAKTALTGIIELEGKCGHRENFERCAGERYL